MRIARFRLPTPRRDSATETLQFSSFRFTVTTLARTPARRTRRKLTPEGWACAWVAQNAPSARVTAMRDEPVSRGMLNIRGSVRWLAPVGARFLLIHIVGRRAHLS